MAVDAVMLAVPVVEMGPVGQCGATLIGVPVRTPISPLSQGRLDEAFGLAVGLGSIGTREHLRDAQLQARLCEGGRVEPRAVVCDYALDCHTQLGVVLVR